MRSKRYLRRVALAVLVCVLLSPSAVASTALRFSFDFRDGTQGWEAGFSDYPCGERPDYEFEAELRELPEEVGAGTGFWLHSFNCCDDLFMFLKRCLGPEDGILPNQEYRVRFRLTFASNAPSGCVGAGGPPGESVYLKAGATPTEPQPVTDEQGYVRMNVDKGNQATGGSAASVVGNIANGIPCEEAPDPAPYVSLTRTHLHEYTVVSNEQGELWLLIGTDSGFEGRTGLYYQSIAGMVWPVFDGSTVAQPADAPKSEADAAPR